MSDARARRKLRARAQACARARTSSSSSSSSPWYLPRLPAPEPAPCGESASAADTAAAPRLTAAESIGCIACDGVSAIPFTRRLIRASSSAGEWPKL
jgi:hypothetical protein